MKNSFFLVKLFKSAYNYLFSFKVHPSLKTTGYKFGKQTTFLCGRCGIPFTANDWLNAEFLTYSPISNKYLISNYFKVLKYKSFVRGVSVKPQIQYCESIRDSHGEIMSCSSCNTSNFQNILVFKILNINIAVVL